MKLKKAREQLEQQLRAIAQEKQKTLDSLKIAAEPRKRKRVYELWQLQNQQQDDLDRELRRVQEKEQQVAARQNVHHPKLRITVGIGFLAILVLFVVAIVQYESSSSITGLSVGEVPVFQVQDKNNQEVGRHEMQLREDGKYNLEINIPDKVSGIGIAGAKEIRLVMKDADILDAVRTKADYYTGTPPVNSRLRTKVVSVEGIGNVNATIHLPKSGNANTNVNTIFRCDDFDQDKFECKGWEATDIPFEDTGAEIIFAVDHFSAYVAGEIVAIDAVHLDENYNFISNIFDFVKTVDGSWSETVRQDEFVRVRYEQNLTDGRMIDVYVRHTAGQPHIEIYEVGTTHIVAQSDAITQAGWKYMTVNGLTHPLDSFDFKIVGGEVEFDYIHDDIISPTQADGLLVYQDSNTLIMRTRRWNESNNFSTQFNTNNLDSIDAAWIMPRASWKHNQILLGTVDAQADASLQIFNDTDAPVNWSSRLEVSVEAGSSSARRGLDVAYEDRGGDALIVYENESTATTPDTVVQFRLWNGTRYSGINTLTLTDVTGYTVEGRISFVVLTPNLKNDQIMTLLVNATNSIYAILWNSSAFDSSTSLVITNASRTDTSQHFTFAWEQGGDGLAFYSSTTSLLARPYTPTGWGDEISVNNNGAIAGLRSCADPSSNYIGEISIDTSSDANVTMWNGTDFLSGGPLQDGNAESPNTGGINVDCAWINDTSAIFGYIQSNELNFAYFFFHKPSTWSLASMTSAVDSPIFGTDDILNLKFNKHPESGELMITSVDFASNFSIIRRLEDGTFASIAEFGPPALTVDSASTEVTAFEWFRYDPFPNVTTLIPALNSQYNANDLIDIGGNVTDNLFLPLTYMNVNITYPNGSNFTYVVSNTTGAGTKFNVTFSTSVAGVYTITFLGNDSRDSLNWTEKTNFTIAAAEVPAGGSKDLISADIFNLSGGTAAQGGGFVVSSTTAGFTNGTSLSAVFTGSTGLSVVNLSRGIININVSLLRNGSHGNYPNVTFAWVLAKSNGSTMLNATIQNNTFNQSAFNYSFNANLLPDGIYNISVFVENISEGATRVVNYSRGFDIAIDRTPPNVTFFTLNISNAASVAIGTIIQFNASLNDSTLSVETVRFGFRSSANSTEFNVTALKVDYIWNVTLATSTMSAATYTVFVYGNDTLGNLNNTVGNLTFTLTSGTNTLPTPPVTGRPFNGSAITNRTPIFDWFNSSDADGDVISYHLQVDDNARFNNPEINVSAIQDLSSAAPENTTWYSTLELAVDTTYYWRVRSNDSTGYGTWSNGASSDGPGDASNLSNFTVNSLLSITMMTNAAEFGEVAPGTEVNTSDQVPAPFRAENTGNIDANVSLNASAIFSTVPINRSAYQFKIRANQSNAFSSALSAMGWTNMTNSTTAAHVVNLTWRSGKNDFLTDINLTIPSDEPSGFKTSTITFTLTRNE